MEILLNAAMELERTAAHYERSSDWRGYANGSKPKTLKSRVGDLHLEVSKTRGMPFYPTALERGSPQ
jgi:transposase-like protein